METKHLLTENSDWATVVEFAYPEGKIVSSKGEIHIKVSSGQVIRKFWFEHEVGKIDCIFNAKPTAPNSYTYESNIIKCMGKEKGTVQINQNRLYCKFVVVDTLMNGFEITIHKGDICYIDGALYHDQKLIMTWTATANKMK